MDPLNLMGLVNAFFVQLLGVQPREIQSTMMTFTGRYGVAVNTPDKAKELQIGYDHFFWGLNGFIQLGEDDPTLGVSDWTRVEYNLKISGKGWNVDAWDAPNNFGALLSVDGGGRPKSLLPGFLHFGQKSTVRLVLSAYEPDPTWTGATRTLGVELWGVKVASDLIPASRRRDLGLPDLDNS